MRGKHKSVPVKKTRVVNPNVVLMLRKHTKNTLSFYYNIDSTHAYDS